MTLIDLLTDKQDAICDSWLEKILGTYPPDTAKFFRKQKNQFANPVGQTLATEARALYAAVLANAEPEVQCGHLDEIIRMRAVQEFTPARAVGFVFLLKDSIREVMSQQKMGDDFSHELLEFDSRIDQLILFAIDIFVKYREKTYAMRVDEIKRKVGAAMRRSGYFVDDGEDGPDRETEQN